MKKISVIVAVAFLLLASIKTFSQNAAIESSVIEPFHLAIGFNKTTNLVFPYAITSVDKGSKDVLAQKAIEAQNILQVKAGKVNFEETNLTVITADGQLYSYVLNYASNPSVLNIRFTGNDNRKTNVLFSKGFNEAVMQSDSKKVAGKKRTLHHIKDKKYGITLILNNVFIREDAMYYQVKIENTSNIRYDIDQLRFFIRDQKKSQRTATQELEVKPLYVFNNTTTVFDHSDHIIVFALPKLTIPDKKYLAVELMEKDGGRHLSLSVKNRHLITAEIIN